MRWRKRGRLYVPDGRLPWARHHAAPPTPLRLDDRVLRVYAAFLDDAMVGRVGYVDLLVGSTLEVTRVSQRPVLDVGARGAFDEHGVMPTCVLPVGNELWLYYVGYRRGPADAPYTQLLGLAISRDGGETFVRASTDPILPATDAERTTRGSAHVTREDAGFVMHYSGGSGWVQGDGRLLPVYNLRRLESADGVTWGEEGRVCVELASDDEHALARPWPIASAEGRRRILYSYRARSHDYLTGMAVSADGETWERRDGEAGLDVSESGWDSEAVAYAAVVEDGDRPDLLLYCGNGRGRTGFGYAELVTH